LTPDLGRGTSTEPGPEYTVQRVRQNRTMSTPGAPAARPVRVLWLIKGLGPGGAEQLLVSSARVGDHARFRYSAAYLRPDKVQLVPALEEAGVHTVLLRGTGRRLGWLPTLRRLMRDQDVVHAHSPLLAGTARLIAITLPPRRRPAVVSTEHNVWGSFAAPTRLLNAVTAPLDRKRWAVSGEVRRSMWRPLRGGAEVLVHGVVQTGPQQDRGTRERVRRELGVPDDAVVAITVANLRREKDYPNLLHAARMVLDRAPGLVVLAVGQGPLEQEIASLHEELDLGERLRLLGYRTDVPDLLAASDLFVLASAHEGLPVSIMEAMLAGLPVVATAVGGVPEAVDDGVTGTLVPAHDARALADALGSLVADPERRASAGAAARERGRRFDISTAVEVQQRAYAELANRGSST
jgi:glycosyltransferase involved in cell wall biosynthesis